MCHLLIHWKPKTVDYKVAYWLQNANDDDYTLLLSKTLTGEGRFHTPGTGRLPGVGAQSEGTGQVTEDEVQGRVTGFNSSDCKKAVSV